MFHMHCDCTCDIESIHTLGPNRNVLFQTHFIFVTTYGLV